MHRTAIIIAASIILASVMTTEAGAQKQTTYGRTQVGSQKQTIYDKDWNRKGYIERGEIFLVKCFLA